MHAIGEVFGRVQQNSNITYGYMIITVQMHLETSKLHLDKLRLSILIANINGTR